MHATSMGETVLIQATLHSRGEVVGGYVERVANFPSERIFSETSRQARHIQLEPTTCDAMNSGERA
jgi:hypothetical protein